MTLPMTIGEIDRSADQITALADAILSRATVADSRSVGISRAAATQAAAVAFAAIIVEERLGQISVDLAAAV